MRPGTYYDYTFTYDDVELSGAGSGRASGYPLGTRWATALGIDRSDLLREALRRHLVSLAASTEVDAYARSPLDTGELALSAIADWGPAEEDAVPSATPSIADDVEPAVAPAGWKRCLTTA